MHNSPKIEKTQSYNVYRKASVTDLVKSPFRPLMFGVSSNYHPSSFYKVGSICAYEAYRYMYFVINKVQQDSRRKIDL